MGCSVNRFDGADSPDGFQIAKEKSPGWVKCQNRRQPPDGLVEALTGRITIANDVLERLHTTSGDTTLGQGSCPEV